MEKDSVVLGYPEYGKLDRVLMHAPGDELDLIRPESYRRYLFEDAVDPTHFRRQHDRLVEILRSEGVDVVLLEMLLDTSSLLKRVAHSPNLVYTRDTVTVTRSGAIRMRMRSPVRRHEPGIAAAAMDQLGVRTFLHITPPATMEGGDLIFLDEETLLVGIGNRTNRPALQQLRQGVRSRGLRTLIAIPLPPWAIHLDGTMMIVDEDLAIVHRESLRRPAIVSEAGEPEKRVDLLRLLRKRGFGLVEVTAYERLRRATNVITLGPRKLVGYSGNARMKNLLVKQGVDFIEIEGSELVRGGGGPRCMTAPIERDAHLHAGQSRSHGTGAL